MIKAVIVRGSIYVLLAALPVWATYFLDVSTAVRENKTVLDHWSVWAYLTVTSVLQALLALRAYIDGSAERARTPEQSELPKP